MPLKPHVDVFEHDAVTHGGYLYTTNQRLSCRLATQRTIDLILHAGSFCDRSILDIACGDGFYTVRFWDHGTPCSMIGVDAAFRAVKIAYNHRDDRPIHFVVGDIHKLPYRDNSFDLVLIQSVLHHDDNPLDAIRESFRLAPEILIHEPNGNNIGLKIIEKTSRYHREHSEKSYTTLQLKRLIKEAGGEVVFQKFGGFVPMFCPDWLARMMKAIEPIVERLPIINCLGCAVCVLVAVRSDR